MIYYFSDNPNGFVTGRRFSVDEPSLTVMAAGMGGDSLGHWQFADDGLADRAMAADPAKPPYRVPSMAEVRAVPWNGLTVASTFAGCGGSSLGYRMAGYRVLWANEFVPAALASYRANMREGTVLDGRGITEVTPAEALAAMGLRKGELDVLDGSPPCQAFSTAGKRQHNWGTERSYEGGGRQRNEDLFSEYIRLLAGLSPRAFVAENVSGLVKGVAKGYFLDILAALKGCGYRVEARLLDAQWLGVPQARQRVIFVGVREDLDLAPAFPSPLAYRYSVRDAIPWIARHGVHPPGTFTPRFIDSGGEPAPAIMASGPTGGSGLVITHKGHRSAADPASTVLAHGRGFNEQSLVDGGEKRKFTIAELRRICAFPDDFELTGSYGQQWERLGNSVPPLMMLAVAGALRDRVLLPARAAARTAERAAGSRARSTSGRSRTGAAPRRPAPRPPPRRPTRTAGGRAGGTRGRRSGRAAPSGAA